VVCATMVTGCGGGAAQEPPTGTILASVRMAGDQSALFLVKADGGGVTRLTPPSPPGVEDFAVSPDGQVAFAAVGEAAGGQASVWIVGPDGQDLRRVGPGPTRSGRSEGSSRTSSTSPAAEMRRW
jgi:hypothetical protein